MNKRRKGAVLALLWILLLGMLSGCRGWEEIGGETIEDYSRARIGIITGSSHDLTVRENFPEAERVYFSSVADMVLAVTQGKIDVYIEDANFLPAALWEGAPVRVVEGSVKQVENGFIFPPGEQGQALREQMNEFIASVLADGTVDRLNEKWLGDREPDEHPDYESLPGENGTIRLAAVVDSKPIIYQKGSGITGLEVELLTRFGREYGYAFDIEAVPFGSVVAGISSGKYDMGASALNITPERAENVDFSDPYAQYDVVLVAGAESAGEGAEKTLEDFENATLGIMTGSVYDDYAKEHFPNAERKYFTIMTDMVLAVEQGKLDGFLAENTYVTAALWEGARVATVPEALAQTRAGFIFRKGEESAVLREQLNEFILRSREDGTLSGLQEKWFGEEEPAEHPDLEVLTGENGTIRIAFAPDLKPVSYVKDGMASGYEIELLWLFAKEYGYKLDVAMMTFDSVLPGVATGKYDLGSGAFTITEERAQSVDFSESHLSVDVVMVTKAELSHAGRTGFWQEIKEDFHKTFLREERWKMIVQGMGVTVLISLSAAAAGSLIGFGLYMLSRSELKLLRRVTGGVAKVYSRIVAGTPVVVILMILFYVVFGKFRDISGVPVAIIGFSLTFGAFVYDHMGVSVGSVDPGQTEAAYALGYTRNKTFFRIVLPQAMSVFLPSYCGQAVELIKATAVVGYIAVSDLTKVSDIIRSNTYEAFFPLIATAVIYFLLTWILSLLLTLVKRRFEPKRRSREEILKGVKTV